MRWEAASCEPGACDASQLDRLEWLPARVPGTAAAVLADAGQEWGDLDELDWWFRTSLPASDEGSVLRFGGIATVSEVFLDGRPILESSSMFERHSVGGIAGGGELAIRCRALAPLLAERRKPRARWRTQLAPNDLRWFRTMLLGRAPGMAPEPAAVGPWRPVTVGPAPVDVRVRTRNGVVQVEGEAGLVVELGGVRGTVPCELRIPDAERWWPHTHGEPVLHMLRILRGDAVVDERRVGFRELAWDDGLHVNGVPVFARGAVWTPVDPVSLAPTDDELRATLERVRDAGMNIVRIPGTGCYESEAFHDLCDELGLLVWQDFMFANFDYPFADEHFRATVVREAQQVVDDLAWRPSLAVLCGNSEVEQQVAMLGLDPELGRGELFGELLPSLAREVDVPYVPSAPSGGDLPFRTDCGVANYYGVGGYRRPFSDVRAAGVRFASECLALANVPDGEVDGREGVPRDASADWDFADVRDHYLSLLYGVEPHDDRYLELSRAASGETMARVFGEWRRDASPCNGALVLWLRDLVRGSGWGLLDRDGRPKVAMRYLARVLAPVAVWLTDEGLNGVDVHVANDRPDALEATLRVALYRDGELCVDSVERHVSVAARTTVRFGVEELLGRFVDAAYAYRFGPPGHDAIVATLGESQAFLFPAGFPLEPGELGLEAELDGNCVRLRTARLAYCVRLDVPGCEPEDDAFSLEPGCERVVALRGTPSGGSVRALNLASSVPL
jgi:beta-mannosidase